MLQCVKKVPLHSLQIFYIIVLRGEIVTTFASNMVTICTYIALRNSQGYIFRISYNILRPNFEILLLLKGLFQEFRFLSGFA